MMERIKKQTDFAIKRGWQASKVQWRQTALVILCEFALCNKEFTVNDFRDKILESGVTTHDNRAMGGLMSTAKGWGWITSVSHIPSLVGHKTPIQVWRSNIYQEASMREFAGQQVLI